MLDKTTTTTNKRRRIAKKACDACRVRKTQCSFDPDKTDSSSSSSCVKCLASQIPCTFLQDRKQRGPVSRRLTQIREDAKASPPAEPSFSLSSSTCLLPIGSVTIQHLVPEHLLLQILDDFLDRVYPVLPLVHIPTFRYRLSHAAYDTDPGFLRLCLALCAVTVASIPRKLDIYRGGHDDSLYKDVGDMVNRASHLILISRLATDPGWQNGASQESMIVSIILAMAAHYAGRQDHGWAYASEAILFFRALELYRKENYANLSPVDAELCKRSFWVLYIIQIHDRMSFLIPHTGLSYDPLHTDWDFLVPLVIDDDSLDQHSLMIPPGNVIIPGSNKTNMPVIVGFVALIKVFLSVANVLSKAFPGQPAPYVLSTVKTTREMNSSNGLFHGGILSPRDGGHSGGGSSMDSHRSIKLEALFTVKRDLDDILRGLPAELQTSHHSSSSSSYNREGGFPGYDMAGGEEDQGENNLLRLRQFEIMWANVYVTTLYIQSVILEVCISSLDAASSSSCSDNHNNHNPAISIHQQQQQASNNNNNSNNNPDDLYMELGQLRENIARELLEVVKSCSAETLESNGKSMIVKIREIAATLLESQQSGDSSGGAGNEEQHNGSRWYVTQFVELLAKLDYNTPNT